ncbi:Restriction endonuclease [Candidatus Methylomirabilis lanthanidiphila]|uniref:Restriction endonuclease n=1 Tax=Candidatus Methylomirabilis lanthanidiphila TaxID=2211376 RepID=A0A564ZFC8_9BACT|nr:restriction endonuclease [Candidatus Methylomirabilis lanthanidiphila]VUZ83846.1 Restriction endonuclease [Candidatus Methylomirabilis lanthanidiphila]
MFILVTVAILLGLGLILLLNRTASPVAVEKAYYQPRGVEQQQLERLAPEQFERLCLRLVEQMGLSITGCHHNKQREIDITAVNAQPITGGSYIVRCVLIPPELPIHSTQVIALSSTVLAERALKGIFITTGFFTEEVPKLAEGPPIELINGQRLRQMMRDYRIPLG